MINKKEKIEKKWDYLDYLCQYKNYYGRGTIHLTHGENFENYNKHLRKSFADKNYNVVENPNLVRDIPELQIDSAGWFWQKNNLNNIAKNIEVKTIISVTKKVNGGENGFAERKNYTIEIYQTL